MFFICSYNSSNFDDHVHVLMNLEDDRNYLLNCLELILDHLCVLMESIICPQVMDIKRSLSLTHTFKHISYIKNEESSVL